MKTIVINESQYKSLNDYKIPDAYKEAAKQVDAEKDELDGFLSTHGEVMTDITTGKTYKVQYLKALSELVGKKYAICSTLRHDGTFGTFYVKPYETFRKRFDIVSDNPKLNNRKLTPNLYQQLGLNKR